MADGYFKAFFQEEYRLGMGANGTVFLCQVCSKFIPHHPNAAESLNLQHVLDGNPLGVHNKACV
jgi:hypothetical protein